jgi:hypothetical protein
VTTRTGDTVTFDFQGCATGAFGLVALQGQLVATYGVTTPGSVDVQVSTPSPRPVRPDIDHAASYLATYDTTSRCLTLAGSSTTTFATGTGVESSLGNYLRCGPSGTCPSSGTLTLTALPDRTPTLTLEYDGDTTARAVDRGVDVTLSCSE